MENDLLPGVLCTNKDAPLLGYAYSGIQQGSNNNIVMIPDFVSKSVGTCDEDEVNELVKGGRLLVHKDTKQNTCMLRQYYHFYRKYY